MAATFEHFVSADVVAEFLGVARETVLALARRGELPAHPLSGDPTLGQELRGRGTSAGAEAVVHGDSKETKSSRAKRAEDQAGVRAIVCLRL